MHAKRIKNFLILFIAQGFGSGLSPKAPGTFGSVVGILWFWLLLAGGNLWIYLAGIVLSTAFSVWCCDKAEKLLGKQDPGCVVLDEIIALPICFLGPILLFYFRNGTFPEMETFLGNHGWYWSLAGFALFRFFDILKPWPVGQSQKLPGGLGITIDDALAGIWVSLILLFCFSR